MEEIQKLDFAGYSFKELWEDLDVCTSHIQEIDDRMRQCAENAHINGSLYNGRCIRCWADAELRAKELKRANVIERILFVLRPQREAFSMGARSAIGWELFSENFAP